MNCILMDQMVLEARKKSVSNRAFTLLELIVALVIVGILGTIVAPNLGRLRPGYEHDQFVSNIRTLVRRGWQESLQNHQLHRLYFDLEKRIARLERETGKKTSTGEVAYEPVSSVYMMSVFTWPEALELKDLFIDSESMLHKTGSTRLNFFWFAIFPDGTAQHVLMNWFDKGDTKESDAGTRFSVEVSPFISKVTEAYGFKKP